MDIFDWTKIRALDGSQANGFEEFCAQLARAECPEDAQFERKGTPDAGVECFCRLIDGGEWGWQAKYFDTLGPSQWSQLDESVNTALGKHPALVGYYVCVPLDRSDARIPGRKSARESWNDHVEKWQGWAQDRGMDVKFVWWGSSELIERVSTSEHIGRLFFWFGQRGFDQDWFRQQLDKAIRAANPRYTPEIHVDLPIAQDMERFGRSDFVITEVKSLAVELRRTPQFLTSFVKSLDPPLPGGEINDFLGATSKVLNMLEELASSPIGLLPFAVIAKEADKAARAGYQVYGQLLKRQRQDEAAFQQSGSSGNYYQDPYRNPLHYIENLQSGLFNAREVCNRADSLANSQLLLLKGSGGMGKTHLLCDFAKNRVRDKLPTVLLMGQLFLSDDEPWVQLLQQLDLAGASAEQFVGALETAAQAADSRALVIIDALNEGNGRKIWQAHLSAFLDRLEKSEWIGVILAVRSGFEKVIPQDVRQRVKVVTHYGFSGKEYDAALAFFSHYNLEFPYGQILDPEFRNPLFLKVLCEAYSKRAERRLPRGFRGITSIFGLYLDVLNERLSDPQRLDFDPSDRLVQRAVDNLARQLSASKRWFSRTDAQQIVNELLPRRDFSMSLYQGLVAENLLMEHSFPGAEVGDDGRDIVVFSYERYADHITVGQWIRDNLDFEHPKKSLASDGGLTFFLDEDEFVPRGILEALSIQVPEYTGREFIRLAPDFADDIEIREAFLNSIVWRKHDAFSTESFEVLNELISDNSFVSESLETLVAVSTVPGHPFNANFLDQTLRELVMPDRDALWSIGLHDAKETGKSVDRLVDWALTLSPDTPVEDEVISLAATTLSWMFCTPNRPLRDQATNALVSLLTSRLELTGQVIERFGEVDDPYIVERVYAAAYGVVMRSHDFTGAGTLASLLYNRVFASGTPPPHTLIRDYARGVIERAIFLGCNLELDEQLIRPPYRSTWPSIPCEDSVEDLFPNWHQASWDSRNLEWSRDRIRSSVTNDDFSRYVIGDDSPSNWLSLGLNEERWQSPAERRQALVLRLNEREGKAWQELDSARSSIPPTVVLPSIEFVDESGNVVETLPLRTSPVDEEAVEQARSRVQMAYEQVNAVLTEEHLSELESILNDEKDRDGREGPRFDKAIIRRYILWRVFDLGWTTQRFGGFDRFSIGYSGRAASKPERIGKKYQWIAYHEILAYLSDHFQYRERYGAEEECRYQGPWQEHLRDIDPSCTLKSIPGGTSWDPHTAAWWGRESYGLWQENNDHKDWLTKQDDIPKVEALLEVINPKDGTSWLNVNGRFTWRQPHPADQGPYDQNRREVRIELTGYFVPVGEADDFISWVKSVDFWGVSIPEPSFLPSTSVYLGEFGWSPAFEHLRSDTSDFKNWINPKTRDGAECPASVQCASFRYLAENGGFDCSVEDSYSLCLPNQDFIGHLGLQWSCNGVDYLDEAGNLAASDPTAHEKGPTALLLRKDLLEKYLEERGLALCWGILGEKWVLGGDATEKYHGRLKTSGAYMYTSTGLKGFLTHSPDFPDDSGIDSPDSTVE